MWEILRQLFLDWFFAKQAVPDSWPFFLNMLQLTKCLWTCVAWLCRAYNDSNSRNSISITTLLWPRMRTRHPDFTYVTMIERSWMKMFVLCRYTDTGRRNVRSRLNSYSVEKKKTKLILSAVACITSIQRPADWIWITVNFRLVVLSFEQRQIMNIHYNEQSKLLDDTSNFIGLV